MKWYDLTLVGCWAILYQPGVEALRLYNFWLMAIPASQDSSGEAGQWLSIFQKASLGNCVSRAA